MAGVLSVGWRRALLMVVDHGAMVGAFAAATHLRIGLEPPLTGLGLIWRASLAALVLQVCMHYSDLYDLRTLHDRPKLTVALLRSLGVGSVLLAVVYYWLPQLIVGRGILLIAAIFIVVLLWTDRVLFLWLSARIGPEERLLIVGRSSAAIELARELHERRHELGVELVGFVDTRVPSGPETPTAPGMERIGTIEDIPQLAARYQVGRVVVSLVNARGQLPMEAMLEMKLRSGIRFDHLASVYEEYTGKIAVENLRPSWLIFSEGFRKNPLSLTFKRGFDILFSLVGLLLTFPIMGIVALGVRWSSPGPALYHQQRVGLNGKLFTVHKFRSMRQDAEKATGAVWATQGDTRVTPFGRFLRRTRLDELPQFWNVIRGDMSFVGPRPERPEFVADLTTQIPFYGERHVVRPGLTGWAQVRHAYGSTVEDALQKLQYDLFYIKHMSIALDLFVVLETIKTVLVRRGS